MSRVCPIYREASEAASWKNPYGNAGLVFNKFASGWAKTGDSWKFDKTGDEGAWLKGFSEKPSGEKVLLEEASRRQRALIEALGGKVYAFRNISRFVMGMGNAHPLENGLTWHPTLGTPYLPGSSLKGVLRAWDLQELGEVSEKGRLKARAESVDAFGCQDSIGDLIFFDVLPLGPVKLIREIMTPHYGGYYQDKKIPGDWESPVPIQYLAVEKDQLWQVGIAHHNREDVRRKPSRALGLWNEIEGLLEEAFIWAGAGAKTAIGFGRFDRCKATETDWVKQREKRREATDKALQAERARLARETAYAEMSVDLAHVRRLADQEGWLLSDGTPNPEVFPNQLNAYLEPQTQLATDVVEWLRSLFEKRHPGLWKNPNETTVKKNKPIHKANWIALVQKVKALEATSA